MRCSIREPRNPFFFLGEIFEKLPGTLVEFPAFENTGTEDIKASGARTRDLDDFSSFVVFQEDTIGESFEEVDLRRNRAVVTKNFTRFSSRFSRRFSARFSARWTRPR